MSIFDRFRKKKGPIIIDALPPSKEETKANKGFTITKVPPVKDKSLLYANIAGLGSGRFITPDWDLTEVLVLESTDGYVQRAFSKKLGLMFKEGFDFVGANNETLTYVKTRFLQISRATSIPHIELLKRVSASLIRTSNAFLIKVRDVKASGGKTRIDATGKLLLPVAGYFPAAPETMSVKLNKSGKPVKWRQEIPGGESRDYSPDDIVHFIMNKREGYIFGVPEIIPVIDDIRALRQMEEHIELLVYQHLFPLYHWKIGNDLHPADIMEDGTREIDYAKMQIQNMPAEGSIVTDHRQQIDAVGAEGRALRADPYLEHFKRRVIAGLGISTIDLGEADSCYSEDTQVLTNRGWLFEQEVTSKDKIATYNPNQHTIEYQNFTDRFSSHREGKMIHIKTEKHVDILVTPNHDIWAKSRYHSKWEKIKAGDLLRGKLKEFYILEGTYESSQEKEVLSNPELTKHHISFIEGADTRLIDTAKQHIQEVPYSGKVWCFTVPNSIFVTRRNGKIAIQGNSNRATSQVMSRALIDSVKSLQDALEAQWNQHVISELLLESTFPVDVLAAEHSVSLQFAEIDIQNKIEQQKHDVELFKNNGITYSELRGSLGKEPIQIPEDPGEEDLSRYPEWANTYWKIFGEPLELIKASDEPWSPAAQAVAQSRSTALNAMSLEKSKQEHTKEKEKTLAKPRPHKTNDSVSKEVRLNNIEKSMDDLKSDIKNSTLNGSSQTIVKQYIYVWASRFEKQLERSMMESFNSVFVSSSIHPLFLTGRAEIANQALRYSARLADRIIRLTNQQLDLTLSSDKILSKIDLVFSVVSKQVKLTFNGLNERSKNYGTIVSARIRGLKLQTQSEMANNSINCDRCRTASTISYPLEAVGFFDLPPYHPNCECKLKLKD